MRILRDMSIRHKLTLLLMGVVSIVLFLVSVANVLGELRTTRTTLATKYSTLAKIVAAQSGAALVIADVDRSGAQQILSDLSVEPSIRFAALYNSSGTEIARHPAGVEYAVPTEVLQSGANFSTEGYLDVVEEVTLSNGRIIGRLLIRATTDELQVKVRQTMVIAMVVYLIAILFALLLSLALQRLITTPILQLARLTERVTTEHNYSLTATSRGNDELGALCERFNTMLAEIQHRDDNLNKSNEELLRSNDELRQFAFVASHDLQEPLRSITSFCNLLREDYQGQLDEQADDYMDRIVNGASRMKALVLDLLAYSRVQNDELIAFHNVSFQVVVDEVFANLQSSIVETGAQIIIGEMPSVFGDRVQLVQLVQNLVGNAIKYRSEQTPEIEISVCRNAKHWEFFVRDNGIGIAPEYHHQIFEIFKRLHGREKYPGTGIGLAVCKRIVQRHGGEITVDSEGGTGCVFRFTLPIQGERIIHEQPTLLASSV